MSRQVRGKRGKWEWVESNQHGPRLSRASLRTNPLKKGIDHGHKGGSTPYFFLPTTQNLVGVGHMTIANLFGDFSGLYEVFLR